MATWGNTNVETDGGDNIQTAQLCCSAAFPEAGTITAATVYLGFVSAANGARMAIYESATADPTGCDLTQDLGTFTMTGSAWNTISGLSIAASAGTYYWIAVKSDTEAYNRYANTLASDWTEGEYAITGETNTYTDAWDDPLATIGTENTRDVSAYFTYTPAASSTVGALINGGLINNGLIGGGLIRG